MECSFAISLKKIAHYISLLVKVYTQNQATKAIAHTEEMN